MKGVKFRQALSFLKRIVGFILSCLDRYVLKYPVRTASWLILLVVLWTNLSLKFWDNPERLISWDVKVYYVYLPATFIYHDLSLEWLDRPDENLRNVMYTVPGPKGIYFIQTTYGLALLYSPFFLAAHAYALISGDEADGYSIPYRFALMLSSIFYLALGIYFLKKLLLKYFTPWVTAVTLIVIVLGTNLYYYSSYEAPMAHAYNFALIAAFLHFNSLWVEKINFRNSVILGFLIGLIALVRPVNLIVVILPLLWGVNSWKSMINRIIQLLKSSHWILLMILVFFILWIPQFLYWKYISGSYFFYSYSDQRFFFNNPQVLSSLLSYRKGLFVYIPLIFLAFCGIPFLFRRHRGLILPVALFAGLNVYILSSWCFWWFGGGFGPRSYIDTYAIMAIPFAALTGWMFQRKYPWILLFVVLISALVWFNFFQTRQYYNGAINWIGMTRAAYWDSFLRKHPTKEFYQMLRFPRPESAKKGIYYQDDMTFDEIRQQEFFMSSGAMDEEDFQRETYIRNLGNYIKTQKSWLEQIREKAEERGISVDSMIRKDAIWLYEQEKKKLEQQKDQ